MKALEFPKMNMKLGVTAEQSALGAKTTPAFVDDQHCITCWQVTWKDLWRMLFNRKVWLVYMSKTMPGPLAVTTEYPFENDPPPSRPLL